MGRFDISPEVAEEYRGKFLDVVRPKLDEDVLAVGTFRTTGLRDQVRDQQDAGRALAYGAASLMGERRAGGLPGSFLLAVTPTKLHAFKYKMKRNGVEAKDEVAAWDRSGLEVGTERLKTTTRVPLEWPGEEKLVCDQDGMGDNPWADDVVRELGGPR
jgi:hypothetical protein